MGLSLEEFNNYCEAVSIIEAQEQLISFTTQDWPNMKSNERKDRHRKLHSLAYPNAWSQAEAMEGEQMAAMLKGLIGGR